MPAGHLGPKHKTASNLLSNCLFPSHETCSGFNFTHTLHFGCFGMGSLSAGYSGIFLPHEEGRGSSVRPRAKKRVTW